MRRNKHKSSTPSSFQFSSIWRLFLGPTVLMIIVGFAARDLAGVSFLNLNSLFLVIGGTLAVFLMSTPVLEEKGVINGLLELNKKEADYTQINAELLKLSHNRDELNLNSHPLLNYAQQLWKIGYESKTFSVALGEKLHEINLSTSQVVATMRNLSKYPPALGMLGTIVGLIGLFNNLGANDQASIGPHLALAMVSTLYGLLLANAFILPLADRFHIRHLRKLDINYHVYRSIILIEQNEPLDFVNSEANERAA